MIASRNKWTGVKAGSKKKKPEQPAKPKMVKPKPAWDDCCLVLSEKEKSKLDKEKMLAKKKLLVSTNNIYTSETDVIVGARPRSALKERNMNIPSAEEKPPVKKEKKERDALDIIMSTKDNVLDNSPSNKTLTTSRGTSSFALPTKSIRQKTPKKAASAEGTEPTQDRENLLDLLNDHDDDAVTEEFALSSQLFGKNTAQINQAVTEVVTDTRQRRISEHTYQLQQSGLLNTNKTFKSPVKEGTTRAVKSLRAASPQRAVSNGRGVRPNLLNTSVATSPQAHNTARSHHTLTSSTAKSIASRTEKDYDLIYVADEVRSLFAELKYYEELSGRQSILDTRQELDEMLQDEALLHPESHKPVMRYLVQLVCQSMTYLLKSEVDLQEERGRYEALNAKFETLNSLLSDDSAVPELYEMRKNLESNGSASGVAAGSGGGVHLMSGSEYLTRHNNNTASVTASVDATATTTTATMMRGTDQGIAYSEADIYPSQFNTPIATRNSNPASTSYTTNLSPHTNTNTTRPDAPSPSLKMIAQQYAQDDLYPIPHEADGEHSVHYDYEQSEYEEYDSFEPSFTLSATKTTPYSSLTQEGVQKAKVTSTPARLQEKIATLSGLNEQKALQLAMNAPPMGLSTPVRSVYNTSASFHSTTKTSTTNSQNANQSSVPSHVYASGGVSSTASTPQVMPYNTYQTRRDYAALGVFSTTSTPNTTNGQNNDYSPYTLLNSPAPYVDAYASFLPSAPPARLTDAKAQAAVAGSAAITTDQVEASLARVDELIRYSHSIASGGYNTIHTPTSAMLGDEYSTIARLTEYKQDITNNSSMLDHSSLYEQHSLHRLDVDTSMFSLSNNDVTPARENDAKTPSSHQLDMKSLEDHLPLPPAPAAASASINSSTARPAYPPIKAIRQPAQASAAQAQLHTTLSNTANSVSTDINASFASANVSSASVTAGAVPGMSGTSASDWLFGAFTTTPTSNTSNSTSNAIGTTIGKNLNSNSNSNSSRDTTPVAQYTAPTTTMHTIPTNSTQYTTSNHPIHNTTAGLVTPTREVVRLNTNKTQSPSTEDLYKTTSTPTTNGFISPDLTADRLSAQNYHYHSTTTTSTHKTSNSSSYTISATTPALQAAVPAYLLNPVEKEKKSNSKTAAASGLVQVKGTTPPRHGSPTKGLKSSRIPLKKAATTEQGSVYVPHSVTALPSPQSAPVHPFQMVATPPQGETALQHKLHHLQSEHYYNNTNNNASTPTLTLEPWQSVQQRVYDARNGCF